MSDKVKDGGPAFPVLDLSKTQCAGATLRDLFAGMVACGIHASCRDGVKDEYFSLIAESAYKQADAMLEAREGGS